MYPLLSGHSLCSWTVVIQLMVRVARAAALGVPVSRLSQIFTSLRNELSGASVHHGVAQTWVVQMDRAPGPTYGIARLCFDGENILEYFISHPHAARLPLVNSLPNFPPCFWADICAKVIQAAVALAFVHSRDVAHGNVCPASADYQGVLPEL
jgi:hypothetical protein